MSGKVFPPPYQNASLAGYKVLRLEMIFIQNFKRLAPLSSYFKGLC